MAKKGDVCRNYPVEIKSPNVPYLYAMTIDPRNRGSCVWCLGNAGQAHSFSSRDPKKQCGSPTPIISINPKSMYCKEDKADGLKWTSIQLLDVEEGDFEEANLAIYDMDGTVVKFESDGKPGALMGKPGALEVVKLKDLDVDKKTTELEFEITFIMPAGKKFDKKILLREKAPKLDIRWEGASLEACTVSATPAEVKYGGDWECFASALSVTHLFIFLLLSIPFIADMF